MHYKKIKNKWSCANTALKITGISLSCILCGASILTMTPFSIPIAAAILGGISLGNTAMTNLLTERFTSKRKKYFRQKCDHIKDYLNKMKTLSNVRRMDRFLLKNLSSFINRSRSMRVE